MIPIWAVLPLAPVDALIFTGETPESAGALALQAERAEVLRVLPEFVPQHWYTHRTLPVDPNPTGYRALDPWTVPDFYDVPREHHWQEPILRRLLRAGEAPHG